MRDYGIWILAALAVISVGLAVLFTPVDQGPREATDFTLDNLDGESITFSSFLGRVVVLDFWATWCKPCIRTFRKGALPNVSMLVIIWEFHHPLNWSGPSVWKTDGHIFPKSAFFLGYSSDAHVHTPESNQTSRTSGTLFAFLPQHKIIIRHNQQVVTLSI